MLYPHWEAVHKAETAKTPFPNASAIKAARWEEFIKKPQPTMSMALSHADLKDLIKKREEEHHLAVKAEIKAMREAYDATEARVNEGFRADLANEYLANPKNVREHILWDKAWRDGHAHGYSNIESIYSDLCELIN